MYGLGHVWLEHSYLRHSMLTKVVALHCETFTSLWAAFAKYTLSLQTAPSVCGVAPHALVQPMRMQHMHSYVTGVPIMIVLHYDVLIMTVFACFCVFLHHLQCASAELVHADSWCSGGPAQDAATDVFKRAR